MMLVDLDDGSKDSLFGVIVKVLAESDLASAVALKRCGSRLKDLWWQRTFKQMYFVFGQA